MSTNRTLIDGRRRAAVLALRAALVAGYGLLLCACNTDQAQIAGVPDVPPDYHMRHPITVSEAPHTLQLFIGANRSLLTPMQRAEVLAFGHTWKSEATGGVIIDLPTGTSNEHASADALREIQSILAATGVPPSSMMVRTYQAGARTLATVRITYPKMTAQAGPCGMWPDDLGPTFDRSHFENQQYWNFGCSYQHNMAAMIDHPEDLVQPRAETPVYTMRRTQVVQKYRQGDSTATNYPSNTSAKISDFGQ